MIDLEAEPEKALEEEGLAEPGNDLLAIYLREISQYKFLNHQEQIAIGTQIQKAQAKMAVMEQDIEKIMAQGGSLTEALCSLETEKQRYTELIERLVNPNLRFVVAIAKRYLRPGLSLLDLIQEGNLGLMRAAERYNASTGNRFLTYAYWWVRATISKAIKDQSKTIRRPAYRWDYLNTYYRVCASLIQELGREPTIEEAAAAMGDNPVRLKRELQEMRNTVSIFTPLGSDDDRALIDVIADPSSQYDEEVAEDIDVRQKAERLLEQGGLSDTEKGILRTRFGFEDDGPVTPEKVGRQFGMTQERVRQIEAMALEKLRNASKAM